VCYQWVRRGRKVTCDNPDARSLVTSFNGCDGFAKSRHGIVPWMCRDVVGRYHSWSDCSVYHYSFDTLPAAGKRLVGTPTPATNSMPRQRLRSIPCDSIRSQLALEKRKSESRAIVAQPKNICCRRSLPSTAMVPRRFEGIGVCTNALPESRVRMSKRSASYQALPARQALPGRRQPLKALRPRSGGTERASLDGMALRGGPAKKRSRPLYPRLQPPATRSTRPMRTTSTKRPSISAPSH